MPVGRGGERKKPYFQRLSPVLLSVFSPVPDLLFDCSRVLEFAKIGTVLQSIGIITSRSCSDGKEMYKKE